MEEYYHYELVGNKNQGGRREQRSRSRTSNQYMAPNVALYDKESEYEPLQINTHTASTKQSPSSGQQEYRISSNTGVMVTDDVVKKRRSGCIAVCVILTTFGVIVFIAIAVGALGLRGSSSAQLTVAKQSQDYTHLVEEISALKSVLSQLNLETKRNISRLSSSAYNVSSSISQNFYSVSRLSFSANSLSTRAHCNSVCISQCFSQYTYC